MAVRKVSTKSAKGSAKKRPSAPVKVTELITDIPVVVAPVVPELKVTEVNPVIPVVRPVPAQPIIPKVDIKPIPVIDSKPLSPEPIKEQSGRGIMVGLVGGSIAGYMAYEGLKTVFLDKGFTQDKANQYAMFTGVACGLLTFAILYSVTKKVA